MTCVKFPGASLRCPDVCTATGLVVGHVEVALVDLLAAGLRLVVMDDLEFLEHPTTDPGAIVGVDSGSFWVAD